MIAILETYARDCARVCWSPMVITVSFSMLDVFRVNTNILKHQKTFIGLFQSEYIAHNIEQLYASLLILLYD